MRKLACLFSDISSWTDWIGHNINVGEAQPINYCHHHLVGLLHAFWSQSRMEHTVHGLYMGHVVGQGCMVPVQAKGMAIAEYPQPMTKIGTLEVSGFSGIL